MTPPPEQGRNVVITGGFGFVGSHLAEQLLARGDRVTIADLAPNTVDTSMLFREDPRFSFVRTDVTDPDSVDAVVTADVDMVFHLSAVVGITHYVNDPLRVLDVNVNGTRNVLEACRRTGSRVLLTSTSEVFGKNPSTPFAEDDDRVLGTTRTARWSYSTSKAMAEHMAFAMHDAYGLPISIVRYFNVYGPRQNPYFVLSQSVARCLRGERPYLYDSGEQTRCFTFVDDAVRGTIMASEDPRAIGEAFNIGSMVESTMSEVVDLVIDTVGHPAVTSAEPVDTRELYGSKYEDIPRRIPDTAKAAEVLGWHLETDVVEGVRRTVEWARANPWYWQI